MPKVQENWWTGNCLPRWHCVFLNDLAFPNFLSCSWMVHTTVSVETLDWNAVIVGDRKNKRKAGPSKGQKINVLLLINWMLSGMRLLEQVQRGQFIILKTRYDPGVGKLTPDCFSTGISEWHVLCIWWKIYR